MFCIILFADLDGFHSLKEQGRLSIRCDPWMKMLEHKPKEQDQEKVVIDLIEQDLSHTKISRRLDISRYRIGRIAVAHGLSDPRNSVARRRDERTLSERQTRMLAFIRNYTASNSYPPSIREIAEGCDISSTSVVDYHIRRLEKNGYLTRIPMACRTIVLTERGRSEVAG